MAKINDDAAEARAEHERWREEHDKRITKIDKDAAEARAENERRLAEIDQRVVRLDERTAETNARVAKLDERLADTRVEIERRLGEVQVALANQLNDLKVAHERGRREDEQRFGKIQDRLLYIGFAIAGLIIAVVVAAAFG